MLKELYSKRDMIQAELRNINCEIKEHELKEMVNDLRCEIAKYEAYYIEDEFLYFCENGKQLFKLNSIENIEIEDEFIEVMVNTDKDSDLIDLFSLYQDEWLVERGV